MTDKYSKDDAIESLRGIYTQAYVSNPAVALGAILEINRLAGFGDPEQAPDQSIMRDHGELKDAIRAIHDVTGPFAPAPDSEPTRPSEPDMMSRPHDVHFLQTYIGRVENDMEGRIHTLEKRAECCDERAVLHDKVASAVRDLSYELSALEVRIKCVAEDLSELNLTNYSKRNAIEARVAAIEERVCNPVIRIREKSDKPGPLE